MKIKPIVRAAALAAGASSAFAGFTVTATHVGSANGLDQYRYFAVNTGGDTGTQIKGLEYRYTGSPAAFEVSDTTDPFGGDPDGIPDTANLLSATRTRIRVSTTASNNTFVGVTPDAGPVQPNAYASGVTAFSGAIANTGTTQASGVGFEIARIYVPVGTTGVFSGNIGGDLGTKVPFSVILGCRCSPTAPPVISPPSQIVSVVFGQFVANGAPFSASVTVTDTDAVDILSLSVGALPASVSNVTITGATGTSPRTFILSGTVSYAANGTDVVIPLIATDTPGGHITTGSIILHVTPEPVLIVSFSGAGALASRRRRLSAI